MRFSVYRYEKHFGKWTTEFGQNIKKKKDAKALPLLELHSSLKRFLNRCSYLKRKNNTEVSGAYLYLC